ncbi:MAG: phosphotransferase enzyme family protein [Bacillota bacterium]
MVSQELLAKAAVSFQFDVTTLVFISNSSNEVYRFTKNNRPYILRLSMKPFEYVNKIKAEVDWVYYLAQNGVSVSLPIHTIDHQLTAVYREKEQWVIATAFHMESGQFFDKDNSQMWGSALFEKWGEMMGKIHLLSKVYNAPGIIVKRDNWSIRNIENPNLDQGNYLVLLRKLKSLERSISSLPRNELTYGLIHNDLHPYNFHINEGEITCFDFDDCIYGWFALDVAIAATHAVWVGAPADDRKSKNEFAKLFLNEFLTGYLKRNNMERNMIQQIPLFMDYRNISSFFWWLDSWDGDESISNFFKSCVNKNSTTLLLKNLNQRKINNESLKRMHFFCA